MKRILIGLLVLVFMIQLVNAAEVCVVVDYKGNGPDATDSKCVEIDEGKNGYELMEEVGWSTIWKDSTNICKINDVGNDASDCFGSLSGKGWMYNLVIGGEWVPPLVTLGGEGDCSGHYCTEDGDVVGFAYGGWGVAPNMFTANVTKIYVDGEKQRESKTRKGKIEEVFPESVVKFKIELESLYHHSTDIEITDISIEGTIEEIDDGDDIDEELSEFDLGADKKKTKELEFAIPLEVEARDRLVKIEIKAEDDAGIKYEMEFTFDLEVEKEDHDVRITNAGLNKDSYICGTNALLSVSLLNIGAKEEKVNLQIANEELEVDVTESFELSDEAFKSSSKYEERFNIWLPDDVSKGTYALMVTADYSGEKETQNVELVISECEGAAKAEEDKGSEETKEGEEVTDVQAGDGSEDEETEAELIEVTKGTTVLEGVNGNMPLVLGGVLIVLVVIIFALGIGFFVVKK